MSFTLITGASSGIGMEMARISAKHGDDLLLIARRSERLNALAEELRTAFGIRVQLLVKDLSMAGAAYEIHAWCLDQGIQVDNLINNAGFGDLNEFATADTVRLEQMIAVNVTTLTTMTRLFLPEMIQRGNGRILNVSSTAAFQPGPLMAVYYATKSYVLSFSEALSLEVRGTGVTVTTLCPGPVRNEFAEVANMTRTRLMMQGGHPTSAEVAEFAYRAMMKGKVTVVHGIMNRTFAVFARILPHMWTARIARFLNGEKR